MAKTKESQAVDPSELEAKITSLEEVIDSQSTSISNLDELVNKLMQLNETCVKQINQLKENPSGKEVVEFSDISINKLYETCLSASCHGVLMSCPQALIYENEIPQHAKRIVGFANVLFDEARKHLVKAG